MPIYIVKSWYKKGWKEKVWVPKTWYGGYSIYGRYIWTDENNVYYSNSGYQYQLDKSTSTWIPKAWQGTQPSKSGVFKLSSGNVYLVSGYYTYKLDRQSSTWDNYTSQDLSISSVYVPILIPSKAYYCRDNARVQWEFNENNKRWSNIGTPYDQWYYPTGCWTDGEHDYYSYGTTQKESISTTSFYLNRDKQWYGLTNVYGSYIWKDGNEIYHSGNSLHYKLDKTSSTWNSITFDGLDNLQSAFYASYVWNDGDGHTYYSYDTDQYELV